MLLQQSWLMRLSCGSGAEQLGQIWRLLRLGRRLMLAVIEMHVALGTQGLRLLALMIWKRLRLTRGLLVLRWLGLLGLLMLVLSCGW